VDGGKRGLIGIIKNNTAAPAAAFISVVTCHAPAAAPDNVVSVSRRHERSEND
jgi:hypothetical protein